MGMVLPGLSWAQGGVAGEMGSLQTVLDGLYQELIPQCSALVGVGRALAGFAALWYVAVRVWRHLARAEPVDVYALLRPFAIGFVLLFYTTTINLMNGVLQPIETGTANLVKNSDGAMVALLDTLANTGANRWFIGPTGSGDEEAWEKYSGQADSGALSGITNAFRFAISKYSYNLHFSIREWLQEILEIFYESAALVINTLRTFNLIVLALLGPLVLGICVFDGFHHSLHAWLARYVKIYLWLPVANVLGWIISSIQVHMAQLALAQTQATGDSSFGAANVGHIVFLIIAIIGYFTVPSIAGYIVQVGTNGMHMMRTTLWFKSAVNSMASVAGQASGWVAGRAWRGADNAYHAPGDVKDGYRDKKLKGD
jgi:conjugative transposon TraJ protein